MKITLPLNIFWKAIVLFFFLAFTNILYAQNSTADTSNTAIAIRNAINNYHQQLFPETNLYNGIEYVDYAYTINEGLPFFETSQFSTGTVEYDNMLYHNIPLLYDEVKEAVVIIDASGTNKIQLNNEKVAGFSLLNHHFVKLVQDSLGKSPIRNGFYDVLYKGNMSVYKKQTKKVLESITLTEGIRRRIDEQNEYFIKSGSTFFVINSKHDVLDITKDNKKEMQQYIRKNKLNFRRAKEMSLIKIAAYYDQLTNK
ncbi:hypothetical protein FC093_15520 [Ilyomonas limi]|uniref:Uncharacterized protein n=1 Tax=Ilyomonas limi TaxID=2575867 RepID=A0A4U3KYF7_9BACT|nr:hypothetical protein [Ilyomonas limi]TKK66909.1 hypothetical protein FC093_15520 [Ilyomonas limi]